MDRPAYEVPAHIPAALAATMRAAADRKTVWVDTNGVAFWLNDRAQAEAIAAKNGGQVFPPEFKPGDVVRFREPAADEIGMRFEVLEPRGPRVLVAALDTGMSIRPCDNFDVADLELAQ